MIETLNKSKHHNISISRKILLIFISVLIIEAFLFAILLSLTTADLSKNVTYLRIDDFLHALEVAEDDNEFKINADFVEAISGEYIDGYVVFYENPDNLPTASENSFLNQTELNIIIDKVIKKAQLNKIYHSKITTLRGVIFYGALKTDHGIYIGAASSEFLTNTTFSVITYILLVYCVVFLLGALIILVYARTIVNRLNKLKKYVLSMPQNNYQEIYIDEGDDEIQELSLEIDSMRRIILNDEEVKEAMLQNVSHDLKTPIAVIRSYAEAIGDKVEDIDTTAIIIEQCEKLEKKVKRFIEFNKLEYLMLNHKELDEVNIGEIINTITLNCKHLSNIVTIETILDDTKFYGKYDNFYTVCENIVENSFRYAKSKIIIKLEKGVLTFYNDGEHIDERFIKYGFKPYEKGFQGKFGLGMSIVYRTLEMFNMSINVQNEEVGVTFIIKAKE